MGRGVGLFDGIGHGIGRGVGHDIDGEQRIGRAPSSTAPVSSSQPATSTAHSEASSRRPLSRWRRPPMLPLGVAHGRIMAADRGLAHGRAADQAGSGLRPDGRGLRLSASDQSTRPVHCISRKSVSTESTVTVSPV